MRPSGRIGSSSFVGKSHASPCFQPASRAHPGRRLPHAMALAFLCGAVSLAARPDMINQTKAPRRNAGASPTWPRRHRKPGAARLMRTTVRLRRQLAWLALCAMVFAALAPATSQWAGSRASQVWTEICGASHTERIALATESTPPADDHGYVTHCPFCRLLQHFPVLPPAERGFIGPAAEQGDIPSGFDPRPPHIRRFRTMARSREPPVPS